MTDRTKEALRGLLLWSVGSDKTGNPYRFNEVKEAFQVFGLDPFAAGSTDKLREGDTPEEEGRYNGWTNYETWSVALIIDNDQGLQEQAQEIAQRVKDGEGEASEYWTEEERRRYRTADLLKDWVEEQASETLELSDARPFSYLWSQLVSAALSDADWNEIADHYLENDTSELVTS